MIQQQQSNPLAATAANPHSDLVSDLGQQHDLVRAQFDKLAQQFAKSKLITDGLTSLAKMGPSVELEDVLKESSKLVQQGIDARQLAGILADAPEQGGAALADWVSQHVASAGKTEAALAPQLEAARHELGLSALRLLAGNHFRDQAEQQQSLTQPQIPAANAPGNNPLMPS